MVGGSMRRDEGSFTISNTNGFSALESLRKKKKSDKVKKSKSSSVAPSKEPEPQVFWAPTPLNAKSWADVDDDDDDDFYATTAPPQASWRLQDSEQGKPGSSTVEESGSESEDDMHDLGDDDVEEEHEHEEEVVHSKPAVQKVPETPLPAKENEKQLSKKERKKKELEELDALLADFGVAQKDGYRQGDAEEKKDGELKREQASDNGHKKDAAPSESKNAKKKKKKDKSSKESKETENQTNNSDANAHPDNPTGAEQADEDASAVDVKERLKKVAAAKKKKSGKELDAAAKVAAQEAAVRKAKLAAAKKKEKNHHYNQQPVR